MLTIKCQNCETRFKQIDSPTICPDCNGTNFLYRYASILTVADHTCSLECIAFEECANELFSKSTTIEEMPAEKMYLLFKNNTARDYLRQFTRSQ